MSAFARRVVVVAGVMGFIGVMAGAFGAHGLREHLTEKLRETFEVAVRYQMYHAVALLGVAWLSERTGGRWARVAAWLLVIGVVIFSGSLYVLVIGEMRQPGHWRWMGAVTPIGGVALMAGWLSIMIAALRR
jgi:uncharacterized membrane protein YgdD (TMEM256/DUF423 family)